MENHASEWIRYERLNALPEDKRKGFAYITLNFVVELASSSDSINQLKYRIRKKER